MRIVGEQVALRDESRDSDTEDLFRWCNLEEWNYYDEPDHAFRPIRREQFDLWRNRPRQEAADYPQMQVDTLQDHHLGWVNCYQHDSEARSIFVGIDLPEPASWGQGCGTEALRLWVDYLFRQMPLQIIRLKTWTGNQRMRRAALKCGFREISRNPHRAELSVRGEPLEFVEYTVSRSEWAARALPDSAPLSQIT